MGFMSGQSQGQSGGMFPRLQNMVDQGGMGGFLSQLLMHGMHNKQMASGMSPEDFQARINLGFANRHQARVDSKLPGFVPPPVGTPGITANFLGRLGGG